MALFWASPLDLSKDATNFMCFQTLLLGLLNLKATKLVR